MVSILGDGAESRECDPFTVTCVRHAGTSHHNRHASHTGTVACLTIMFTGHKMSSIVDGDVVASRKWVDGESLESRE